MSAAEAFKNAMDELRQEQAKAISQHREDAAKLAELTTKLNAGLNGDPSVDIAAMAAEVHEAAMSLRDGLASTVRDAAAPKTANADTSYVSGGSAQSADVVSASSPGVIVPDTDAPNSAVPDSLGGGAMAVPAEPDLPDVKDTPDVQDVGKKGGKKG